MVCLLGYDCDETPPMQLALQRRGPENGSTEPNPAVSGTAYACSVSFRPPVSLACEHMFSRGTSPLTQRALAAAGLIRSFLLLEDDPDVDWEVDGQDGSGDAQTTAAALHARKLTRPVRTRRHGESAAASHPCLSPVGDSGRHEQVRSRRSEGTSHRGRPSCGRPSPQ